MSHLMTKPTKWHVRPAKTQISLGIHPAWSESSLSTWRKLGPLATHCVHTEDWSDWADAQADLSLCWVHMPFCCFCHAAAHILFIMYTDIEVVMTFTRTSAPAQNTNFYMLSENHWWLWGADRNFHLLQCSFSVFWEWGQGLLNWKKLACKFWKLGKVETYKKYFN